MSKLAVGDRVLLVSENRPEWAMADYAVVCAGGWSVPIYPTLPAAQVAPLLCDSGAKAVFVSSLEQLGKTLDRATRTMTALLAGIAAVSLIVGGIGIMNIMLLSVTERTREIGVRRAVGARARDIRSQFVLEAMTLSVTGGVVGVCLGLVAAAGLSRYLHWSTTISPAAVVVAVGVAAGVGVFFGWYPARQAARLDPIQSLRYE